LQAHISWFLFVMKLHGNMIPIGVLVIWTNEELGISEGW
jgi:hypothetical protein